MPGEPHRIGRYEVKRELGHGAMGVVYLAFDPLLKRLLAIKTVREFGPDAESTLVRFQREAEISARLNHPNIVTVHDVGEDPLAGPFLAMEFVDGLPLSDLIRQGLPPESTLDLLLQGASALQAAERAGIVHRDVKPANILVSHDGRLKLMDFGIARGEDARLTQTGQIMGTPSYTAPEALAGAEPSSVTDHYAFAVTAFQMLSGLLPFECATIAATLFRIVHDPPLFPDSMPAPQRRVFERALAKEPGDRYPTLTAFMRDLVIALALPADLQARFLADLADGSGVELAHLVQSHVEEAATLSRMATQPTFLPDRPMDTRELATEALRTPWPDAGVPRPSGVPGPLRAARPAPASRPGQITRPALATPTLTPPSRATQPSPDPEAPSRVTQPSPLAGPATDPPARTPSVSLATQMFPSLPARSRVGSQSTQPMPTLAVPGAPGVPDPPAAPQAPDHLAVSEAPEAPDQLAVPEAPEAPDPPVAPEASEARDQAAAPETPEARDPVPPRAILEDPEPPSPAEPGTGLEPPDGPVPADALAPADRRVAPRRTRAWMAVSLVAIVLFGALWLRRPRFPRPAPLPGASPDVAPAPAPPAVRPLPGGIRLAPAAAELPIITRPAGAQAFLNGHRVGVTPLLKLEVPATGVQHLELRLKNYQVWEGEIRAGSAPPVIPLVPLLARLRVRTEPAGGAVFLDGKPVGIAPLEHLSVPMGGSHTLRISRAGYEDWSAALDPARGLPDPIVLVQARKVQGASQGPVGGSAAGPAHASGEPEPSREGTQAGGAAAAHPATPSHPPEPREGRH